MSDIKFEQRKTIEQVEESTELAPKFDRDGLSAEIATIRIALAGDWIKIQPHLPVW